MPIGIMGSKSFVLLKVQGDSGTKNENEGTRVFALFPSTTLKHLEVQLSNHKKHHYP